MSWPYAVPGIPVAVLSLPNGTVARFCHRYTDSGMAGRIGSLFAAFEIRWLYSYPSWMACSTVIPGTRTERYTESGA